jgi:hypothetical protein
MSFKSLTNLTGGKQTFKCVNEKKVSKWFYGLIVTINNYVWLIQLCQVGRIRWLASEKTHKLLSAQILRNTKFVGQFICADPQHQVPHCHSHASGQTGLMTIVTPPCIPIPQLSSFTTHVMVIAQ